MKAFEIHVINVSTIKLRSHRDARSIDPPRVIRFICT